MNRLFFTKWMVFLLIWTGLDVCGQKTEMNAVFEATYHKAIELYQNKAYAGAQNLFVKVSKHTNDNSNLKTNADYYDAICAIKLKQTEADAKVLAFVKNHPYSSKKEKIYLHIGNYYFANRKASHALKWYTKVDQKLLNSDERDELNYKMGYALLVSNYLADAKEKFSTLLGSPVYGNDARYYFGYISYKQENFGEAEDNLSQLANNATYKSKASYYLLDIAFKNGNFAKAAEVGEKILPTAEKGQTLDIIKVIGESYFNLGQYEKAIPHLLEHKEKKGKWNNTDLYYLGYAYYKLKDYENAVLYFTKIIDGKNLIAQNAYYHLGACYLRLDKKGEALNAFKNAGEMTFNADIKADADLNYAKLSYEEGNPYQSVPEVLKTYLTQYPNSEEFETIKELLITSYLHQQDYQGAIDYLQENQNPENNAIALEVSLYRGIQLFNQQKIQEANPHFLIASSAQNDTISNKAKFWMAETDYLLGNYQSAVNEFSSVDNRLRLKETNNLAYNLGYAYFKLKDYTSASQYFKEYINQQDADIDLKQDAMNRLGDTYYATKQYAKAIDAYQQTINQNGIGSDYALYQKAISNGLSGNRDEKIQDLLAIIETHSDSNLKDDALYQLATTYTAIKNTQKAHHYYNELLKQHPKSNYIPSVLLRQGLLFYNNDNHQKALAKFKDVANRYPNATEAKQAVANARNVYIDIGAVEEYVAWVETLPYINITNKEIDDSSFMAVENKFLEGDFTTAIKDFNNYITKFPKGIHLLKAQFYLAESYLKKSEKEKAIPHYSYVTSQEKNEYTEEALSKLSQIYLENGDWSQAIVTLEQLEKSANREQNILFAQSNLMKGYYQNERYERSKEYAEKVLIASKIDQQMEEEARLIIARTAIKTGDFETAEEYYDKINETATGEMKAETLYHKALFLNQSKNYETSNKEIQNLIAKYSTYQYWGVKSYLVMAKNYDALKDTYQATYILENIIKNFTQFPDLVSDAKKELQTIKFKASKTNKSVNTNISTKN